jgi:hypothetical protein
MSIPAGELDDLLSRFDAGIVTTTRDLLAILAEVRPDLSPAVKTGWGSVNYRHPTAGFVCAVFPQARERNVILVFEQGRLLSSPLLRDNGKVKQVRWIELRPGEGIPVDEIAILIAEAIALRA